MKSILITILLFVSMSYAATSMVHIIDVGIVGGNSYSEYCEGYEFYNSNKRWKKIHKSLLKPVTAFSCWLGDDGISERSTHQRNGCEYGVGLAIAGMSWKETEALFKTKDSAKIKNKICGDL